MSDQTYDAAKVAELLERIDSYFGNGGLFNPELMEHDKVRQLLLDVVPLLWQVQRLQARTIRCCFCDQQCESLEALKTHSAECRQHPLAEQVQRLTAEVERLRGKPQSRGFSGRPLCPKCGTEEGVHGGCKCGHLAAAIDAARKGE